MSKGLTLIESLIGLAIVSFGVFFIILVFPLVLRVTYNNEKNNSALFLASAKIEEMIALNYENLQEGTFSENYENYRTEIKISCFHPNRECVDEETGMKKIEIDVFMDLSSESVINLITLVTKK